MLGGNEYSNLETDYYNTAHAHFWHNHGGLLSYVLMHPCLTILLPATGPYIRLLVVDVRRHVGNGNQSNTETTHARGYQRVAT